MHDATSLGDVIRTEDSSKIRLFQRLISLVQLEWDKKVNALDSIKNARAALKKAEADHFKTLVVEEVGSDTLKNLKAEIDRLKKELSKELAKSSE